MSTISPPPQHDLGSLRIDDRARRPRKAGRRLGIFAATLGAVVLLGGLLLAFRTQKPVVEVAAARPANDARATALLNASGYVTPRRRATIAAKITGRVTSVLFDEGMHVRPGQVLATLDDSDARRALEYDMRRGIAAAGVQSRPAPRHACTPRCSSSTAGGVDRPPHRSTLAIVPRGAPMRS